MPRFEEGVNITTSGFGNVAAPAYAKRVLVEAWSTGGSSGSTTAAEGAGAGGNYARTFLSITGGTTIFYNVGAQVAGSGGTAGNGSWVNISSNAQPTTTSQGCYAVGGPGGTTATGATASSTGSVGDTIFTGGNGGNGAGGGGTRGGGGGGGGAGSGGNGGNGGAGGNGTSGPAGTAGAPGDNLGDVDYSTGGGGAGGAGSITTAAGGAGNQPGGAGGGGSNQTGSNGGTSPAGRIRISWNRVMPVSIT